jgi:hypothetical protein
MWKRAVWCLLPAAILLTWSGNCSAFDGQRKGFIIGTGLGFGLSHVSSSGYETDVSEWRVAPGASARIGFAPDNRTAIFFGMKTSFTYMDMIADKYESYSDKMHHDGIQGVFATMMAPLVLPVLWVAGTHSTVGLLGVTRYFKDAAPSFFLEGTLGLATVPNRPVNDVFGGFGLTMAGGYEISPHVNIRADLMFGFGNSQWRRDAGTHDYFTADSDATTILVTINALAY